MNLGSISKPYHNEDLRRILIEKGREELLESGAHSLSLRQVARRSGVSHMAPYRHFNDKSELMVAIAMDGFEHLKSALSEARLAGDPVAQLKAAGKAYVKMFLQQPETAQLMFGGLLNEATGTDELEKASRETFAFLEEIIEEGVHSGLFSSLVSVKDLALMAWSTTHGLAMLRTGNQLSQALYSADQIVTASETISEILLSGLLKR